MNQNDADHFERSIKTLLDQGLNNLPPTTLKSLEDRRKMALANYPSSRVLVKKSVLVSENGAYNKTPKFDIFENPLGWLIPLLLVLSVWSYQEWQSFQDDPSELEEIDSALLSGELPIDAYLDKGFTNWLNPSSE